MWLSDFIQKHFSSKPGAKPPQVPPLLGPTEAEKMAKYLATVVHDGKMDYEIHLLYQAAVDHAPAVFAELWAKVVPAIDVFVAASPGQIDNFAWPAIKGYINARLVPTPTATVQVPSAPSI